MSGTLIRLGVPIDSVGGSGGTELGPAALRRQLTGLTFREGGDCLNRLRGGRRDPTTGWLDFEHVLEVTGEVRTRVGELAAPAESSGGMDQSRGAAPPPLLVLGGCCTLVPAVLAGMRDAAGGKPLGLAYLDGHLDLYEGHTSPTGEGADMPVATALGKAPQALLDRLGTNSLLDSDRLCLIGARDPDERADVGDPVADWGIGWFRDRDSLRGADLAAVGASAAEHLAARGRFWLALDVDILDQDEFPATDYLMPDGLTLTDLGALIGPLASSPALAGLSVTCFNPEKDPDGRCGRALADLLTAVLA